MGKAALNDRLRCTNCSTTDTPLWRSGPDGPKTLCNACGVRWKKGKLVYGSGGRTALPPDYLEKKAAAAAKSSAKANAKAAAAAAASTAAAVTAAAKAKAAASAGPSTIATNKVGSHTIPVAPSSDGGGKVSPISARNSPPGNGLVRKSSGISSCPSSLGGNFTLGLPSAAISRSQSSNKIKGGIQKVSSDSSLAASLHKAMLGTRSAGQSPTKQPKQAFPISSVKGRRVRKQSPPATPQHPWRSPASSPKSETLSNRDADEDMHYGPPDIPVVSLDDVVDEADPYFAAEVDEALSKCRILPIFGPMEKESPKQRSSVIGDLMQIPKIGANQSVPRVVAVPVPPISKMANLSMNARAQASKLHNEPSEQDSWVTAFTSNSDSSKNLVQTSRKPNAAESKLPRGQTASVVSDTSLDDIRGIVHSGSGNNISAPYERCVKQLANLCSKLDKSANPKDYVKAFVYDQSSCGSAVGDDYQKMHDLALTGYFADGVLYSYALGTFREVFASAELVEFCIHEFAQILADDVIRAMVSGGQKGSKCAADDFEAKNLKNRLVVSTA